MRKILILLACAVSAIAQTQFPSALDTDQQLIVAGNRVSTTLAAPVAVTDTLFLVTGTAGIVPTMLLSVDLEIVQVSAVGTNTLTVARGFDGTSPATHTGTSALIGYMTAMHHNALRVAVKAIESALGPNLSNVATLSAAFYAFAPQSPGGSLIAGNNVITLSPVPAGVNGSDTHHPLYVSGGTGTAEACTITGGAGVAGQSSGQIIMSCANAHSGAWTVQSATAGIQEAIVSAAGPSRVAVNTGTFPMYGPVWVAQGSPIYIQGAGMMATTLTVAAAFGTASPLITENYVQGGAVRDLTISYAQPTSSSIGAYTQYSPVLQIIGSLQFEVERVQFIAAWTGIYGRANGRLQLTDVQGNAFSHVVDIDAQADVLDIKGMEVSQTGLNATQAALFITNSSTYALWIGYTSDAKISHVVSNAGKCANLHQGISTVYSSFGAGLDGFIAFDDLDCDNAGGFEADGEQTRIVNGWFTIGGVSGRAAITQTGGSLQIANSHFYGTAGIAPITLNFQRDVLDGQAIASSFMLTGSEIEQYADVPMLTATWTSYANASDVILTGNKWVNTNGAVLANPIIQQTIGTGGGKAVFTITGNQVTPKLAGSGTFISLASDFAHVIAGNSMYGWGYSLATGSNPVFSGNAGAVGNRQQLNVSTFDDEASAGVVASASSVTPIGRYFQISGTAAIATITVPPGTVNPRFCALPTGNWTTTTGGNITVASTAVQGKPLCMKYDAITTKWGPSY